MPQPHLRAQQRLHEDHRARHQQKLAVQGPDRDGVCQPHPHGLGGAAAECLRAGEAEEADRQAQRDLRGLCAAGFARAAALPPRRCAPTTRHALPARLARWFLYGLGELSVWLLCAGLHEDLNRIRQKPPWYELEDIDGESDTAKAARFWDYNIKRNSSPVRAPPAPSDTCAGADGCGFLCRSGICSLGS